MIVEGIVATRNAEGAPHLAPMGPIVDRELTTIHLRPFKSSTTYQHLVARRRGAFHVIDDVLLLARAAVGALERLPPLRRHATLDVDLLEDACRWFVFEVASIDDASDRAELRCEIVDESEVRPFFGLCRAKHAVVEAAILATRLHITPLEEIAVQLRALEPLVRKTGGDQEIEAFDFLARFIHDASNDENRC